MKTHQSGMSSVALLMVLVAFAFVLLTVFRIGPLYLDNYFVKSSVEALQNEDINSMSNSQIYTALNRQLIVNGVRDISSRDAKLERTETGVVVKLDYEKRVNFFANLDVVVTFTNHFDSADY